jgi:hypothetical protein
MTTYFVFGNTPVIKNLLEFTGKDEKYGDPVKIKDADFKEGHYLININDHPVGILCNESDFINAIYAIDEDSEGTRLFRSLVDQWSEIYLNHNKKEDVITVADDEMGLFFNYL